MRYLVLDSWRGICACLVVLYHFQVNSPIRDLPFLRNSFLFVDFFFVLSGFVIYGSYRDRLANGFGVGRFMTLRFARVYPLHFAMLLIYVLTEAVFYKIIPQFSGDGRMSFSGSTSVESIFTNLLLIHSLGVHNSGTWNGPSWSISTEFYTYLIFALSIVLFRRWLWIAGIFAVVAGPIAIALLTGHIETTYDYGIIRCVYGFSLGAMVNYLVRVIKAKNPSSGFETVMALSEPLAIGLVVAFVSFAGYGLISIFVPYIFALAVFVFAFERGAISRFLKLGPWLFLGTLSYSIYMIHSYIQSRLSNLATLGQKFFDIDLFVNVATPLGMESRLGPNPWFGTLSYVVMLAIVICASYFSYRFIEVPAREWIGGLSKRRSVMPLAATKT